jgi:hypothetical protein
MSLAAALLLAGALGGPGSGPARAATAACKFRAGAQPPSPGEISVLRGVAVLSACDAWAVGGVSRSGNVEKTLIEHWDGSRWKVSPSPSPGTNFDLLTSVSAASPTSIWAVGSYDNGLRSPVKTLILHWNGHRWTKQDAPSPDLLSRLTGVAAVSGGEAWAVGDDEADGLVLHFTGGRWTRASIPPVDAAEQLNGVAATSATDVWVVGEAGGNGADMQTLILHWDGQAWTHPFTQSPADFNVLTAVDASSPTSAMAVGYRQVAGHPAFTLVLRWNGRSWNVVDSPNPKGPSIESFFTGVAVTSKDSARAVGTTRGGTDSSLPLIEQWDGTSWHLARAPAAAGGLAGIGASSASNQWAVGDSLIDGGALVKALALHFG